MCDSLHNKIATLCLKHFNNLPKTGKPTSQEWTVFSCIILQNKDDLRVVASGTGSKCIGMDKMSSLGYVLNDSHAEIVCRRAFMRFLYEDMLSSSSEKLTNFCPDKHKFIFCDSDVKWHFFTTMMPCGDAAIVPKEENLDDFGETLTEEPTAKRLRLDNKPDIHRTGAKCLKADSRQDPHCEGTDYHVTGVVRTKPGRGVQTLSVSCSDKLAKWCHLGVQGALLSLLLEGPVYLSSVTIADNTSFNRATLERALFHRLDTVELTSHFKRHGVCIEEVNVEVAFRKSEGKQPCPSSIVWFQGIKEGKPEIAVEGRKQGITKQHLKTEKASLKISKYQLFKCFLNVLNVYNIKRLGENLLMPQDLTYRQVKLLSVDYQQSWGLLKKCFGVWSEKNVDLLQFKISGK